jgi:hypothetical protein
VSQWRRRDDGYRALGFGLKYSAGFGFTHLGRIGKGAAGPA